MALKSTVNVGDVRQNNLGEKFTVVEWVDSYNVTVQFEDGTVRTTRNSEIKAGSVKNPMTPSVFGVGFYGQIPKKILDNFSKQDIKQCYTVWIGMLGRCYSDDIRASSPSYKGCTVDTHWFNFSTFAEWYLNNEDCLGIDDLQVDKDLLGNGKLYSPECCCLIPRELNQSLQMTKKSKYNLLAGVTLDKGKFKAQVNTLDGKVKHLGVFTDERKAHETYLVAKKQVWKELYDKYEPTLSNRVLKRLQDILSNPRKLL
ncbi:hypothetical protein D3C87_325160 [compost metagenome]